MNDREMQLMTSGMKLFAEKGYHSSSVQEIANEAGVSKGTFYLYFHSKEDFITQSIQFHHEEITSRMQVIKTRTDLSAQESMAAQIAMLVNYVDTYKDFIMMHLRENVPTGEGTDQLLWDMKVQNFYWIKDNLQAIYSGKLDDYFIDAVIQCEGLLNGYFKWMVVDGAVIDSERAGSYLVKRIDDLVSGMLADNQPPLISWAHLPKGYSDTPQNKRDSVHHLIDQIKTVISESDLSEARQKELIEVADMIEAESFKDAPQRLFLQGMLAHYMNEPVLRQLTERLAAVLDVSLLD